MDYDKLFEALASQLPGEADADGLELSLWALVRGPRRAEARTRKHLLGVELVILVDGEVSTSQVFRPQDVELLDSTSVSVRRAFEADGWSEAGPRLIASPATAIEAALQRLVDAWNAGDAGAFGAAFAESAEYRTGAGQIVRGQLAIGRLVEVTPTERVIFGEPAVVVQDNASATATVSWRDGIDPLGRRGTVNCWLQRIDGDWRIARLENHETGRAG
jgi:hypothetical protein